MNFLDIKVAKTLKEVQKGDYLIIESVSNKNDYISDALYKGAAGVIDITDLYNIAKEKLMIVRPTVVFTMGKIGKSVTNHYLSELVSLEQNTININPVEDIDLATLIINCVHKNTEVIFIEVGSQIKNYQNYIDILTPKTIIILNSSNEQRQNINNLILDLKSAKISPTFYINKDDQILNQLVSESFFDNFTFKYFPNKTYSLTSLETITNSQKQNLNVSIQVAIEQFGINLNKIKDKIKYLPDLQGRLQKATGANNVTIINNTNNYSTESIDDTIEYLNKRYPRKESILIISSKQDTIDSSILNNFFKNFSQVLSLQADNQILTSIEKEGSYRNFINKDKLLDYIDSFDLSGNKLLLIYGNRIDDLNYIFSKLKTNKKV